MHGDSSRGLPPFLIGPPGGRPLERRKGGACSRVICRLRHVNKNMSNESSITQSSEADRKRPAGRLPAGRREARLGGRSGGWHGPRRPRRRSSRAAQRLPAATGRPRRDAGPARDVRGRHARLRLLAHACDPLDREPAPPHGEPRPSDRVGSPENAGALDAGLSPGLPRPSARAALPPRSARRRSRASPRRGRPSRRPA